MAAPTVPSQAVTADQNSAAPTLNLPTGIAAGDELYAFVAIDSSVAVSSWTGWTQVFDQAEAAGNTIRCVGYRKTADGSEGATDANLTLASANQVVAHILRVAGAGTTPEAVTNESSSSTPDPGLITPAAGADDWLYIVAIGVDTPFATLTDVTSSAYSGETITKHTSEAVSLGTAYLRTTGTTTENPAAGAIDNTEQLAAGLVAVPPAAAGFSLGPAASNALSGSSASLDLAIGVQSAAAAVSGSSAALSLDIAVIAAAPGISGSGAVIELQQSIAATAAAVSDSAGTLTLGNDLLAGLAASQSAFVAPLSLAMGIGGSLASDSATGADLALDIPLGGQAAAQSAAAALLDARPFLGALSASASDAAAEPALSVGLAGEIVGLSAAAADLPLALGLFGAPASVSSLFADLGISTSGGVLEIRSISVRPALSATVRIDPQGDS